MTAIAGDWADGGGETFRSPERFDPGRWVGPLVAAGALASLFSIFISGLMLALGAAAWLWDCGKQRRLVWRCPPFTGFLALFLGLALVAVALSPDPGASLPYLKKFLRFLSVFLLFTYFRKADIERALWGFFLVAGASAGWGLLEYFWLKDVNLLNRIDGFMSHWMTFSGQMMLAAVMLGAYLALIWWPQRRERPRWVGGVGVLLTLVLLTAVLLTQTRSAWMGVIVGLGLLLACIRFRLVLLLAVGVVAGFWLLPATFQQRFYSGFDVHDTTTRGRIDLFQTGLHLITAHPWHGVGPRLVYPEALKVRGEKEIPDYAYQHLHNNCLQIGAELGLPALLVWIGLWLKIVWDFLVLCRSGDRLVRPLAISGLCSLAAFQVMGLLEYNFGDAEIVVLLLFLITIPYVAADRAGRGVVG